MRNDRLIRDRGAVLNVDDEGLAAYRKRKANARRVNTMAGELETLKADVAEVKELLRKILEK